MRWDSNPRQDLLLSRQLLYQLSHREVGLEPTARPPSFKAVALPTEPPWQLSWLGSNHTSYTRQSVKLVLINRVTHTHYQGTHPVNLVRFFLHKSPLIAHCPRMFIKYNTYPTTILPSMWYMCACTSTHIHLLSISPNALTTFNSAATLT